MHPSINFQLEHNFINCLYHIYIHIFFHQMLKKAVLETNLIILFFFLYTKRLFILCPFSRQKVSKFSKKRTVNKKIFFFYGDNLVKLTPSHLFPFTFYLNSHLSIPFNCTPLHPFLQYMRMNYDASWRGQPFKWDANKDVRHSSVYAGSKKKTLFSLLFTCFRALSVDHANED